jgi:hypothetical protein
MEKLPDLPDTAIEHLPGCQRNKIVIEVASIDYESDICTPFDIHKIYQVDNWIS